jgi:hypothetical protein
MVGVREDGKFSAYNGLAIPGALLPPHCVFVSD